MGGRDLEYEGDGSLWRNSPAPQSLAQGAPNPQAPPPSHPHFSETGVLRVLTPAYTGDISLLGTPTALLSVGTGASLTYASAQTLPSLFQRRPPSRHFPRTHAHARTHMYAHARTRTAFVKDQTSAPSPSELTVDLMRTLLTPTRPSQWPLLTSSAPP